MSDFNQSMDVINFITATIGHTNNVYINSYIYQHYYENSDECSDYDDNLYLHPKKDIHKLCGSKKSPITLEDITKVFRKMKRQFDKLIEDSVGSDYGTYIYEGLEYNEKKQIWEIYWGT